LILISEAKHFRRAIILLRQIQLSVTLEDAGGKNLFVKIVAPNDGKSASTMLFNRYENQYFWATIILPDIKTKLPLSNVERQLARNQNSPTKTFSVEMKKPDK
jgi:hypothetical protein